MKPLLTIAPEAAAFLEPKLKDFAGVFVRINKKGCAGGEYEFTPLKAEDVKKEFEISKQLTAGANELVAVLPNLISQMEADYTKFLGGKPMPEMAKSATTSRPEDNPAAIGTPDRQK